MKSVKPLTPLISPIPLEAGRKNAQISRESRENEAEASFGNVEKQNYSAARIFSSGFKKPGIMSKKTTGEDIMQLMKKGAEM